MHLSASEHEILLPYTNNGNMVPLVHEYACGAKIDAFSFFLKLARHYIVEALYRTVSCFQECVWALYKMHLSYSHPHSTVCEKQANYGLRLSRGPTGAGAFIKDTLKHLSHKGHLLFREDARGIADAPTRMYSSRLVKL